MRLPEFLVIGAMKAGTTSLFFDLRSHPAIHLPDKELGRLNSDDVLSSAGREAYARVYRGAGGEQICGDVSTDYAKLPDFPGVARRARLALGPRVRIVYIVREPVARTLSHHHHALAGGVGIEDVDAAVRELPALVDYSKYWMQLEPWLEAFPDHQVRVVRFEDYISDRKSEIVALSDFLGVERQTDGVDQDRIFNQTVDSPIRGGRVWRLSRGRFYQRWIRPRIPRSLRSTLRQVLLAKAPPRPSPPSLSTVDHILEAVADDVGVLSHWVGGDGPLWDLDAVRLRYQDGS